jgi:antitoxin component of RelBE/YafQ-DinJ toxin-antitoxin module
MSATSTVTARVPREIKQQAELVFKKQGMTATDAINRLYESTSSRGYFPERELPDPHAFPEPGKRRLDPKTMTDEQKRKWEAIKRLRSVKVEDWGDYHGRPCKEVIAEGRLRDYEALS